MYIEIRKMECRLIIKCGRCITLESNGTFLNIIGGCIGEITEFNWEYFDQLDEYKDRDLYQHGCISVFIN